MRSYVQINGRRSQRYHHSTLRRLPATRGSAARRASATLLHIVLQLLCVQVTWSTV